MRRNYDWSHPLPFGDSVWVKKADVEPLVKAVRKMLDEIYEFGSVVSNEHVEMAEGAYIKLVVNEPANTGLQADVAFWHCPKCNFLNYPSWSTCARCDEPQPAAKA